MRTFTTLLRLGIVVWALLNCFACDLGSPPYEMAIRRVLSTQSSAFFSTSSSGRHMAYRINRRDGFELVLHDLKSGEDYSLGRSSALLTGARFSPDSKLLAIYHGLPEAASILVYDVATRRLLMETAPRFHASSGFATINWSVNSKAIFVLEKLPSLDVSLRSVDIQSGREDELLRFSKRPFAMAQIGASMLVLDSQRDLYVLEGGARTLSETPLMRRVEEVRTTSGMDGAAIRVSGSHHGSTVYYATSLEAEPVAIPELPPETSSILPFSRDLIAFTREDGISHTLRLFGGETAGFEDEGTYDTPISWTADGKQLTFTRTSFIQPPLTYTWFPRSARAETVSGQINKSKLPPGDVEVVRTSLTHSKSVLTIPGCRRRPAAAAIYVKSSPLRTTWIPIVSYFNSLGLPVLIMHLPLEETDRSMAAVEEALAFLSKRFELSPGKILLSGESFGANVSALYARTHDHPLLGIVDIGGREDAYKGWDLESAKLGWIESFQGEFDAIVKKKSPVMNRLTEYSKFGVEYTLLKNDGHVIIRLDNWERIYRTIGERLNNDGLIRECLN